MSVIREWLQWHLRDKYEERHYEGEYLGIGGTMVAVASVLFGVATCLGLFALAVLAAS